MSLLQRIGIINLPGGTRIRGVDFDTAIGQFLERLRARGKSLNTLKAYGADLVDLQVFAITKGVTLAGLITDRLLEHWLDDMSNRRIALRTQARKLCAVRTFLKHARTEGWINRDYDPTSELGVRFRPRRVVAPELADLLAMIERITVVGENCVADLAAIRDRAMLRLALDAGLRIGEVSALDVPGAAGPQCTVDLKRRMVHVPAKGGGVDTVAIDAATCTLVERWLTVRAKMAHDGEVALFVSQRGRRFHRQGLHTMVRRRGEAAGLGGLHWHLLRHRRIGHIYETLGARVAQEHARHAQLATTENTYGAHAAKVSHQLIRQHAPLDGAAA